MLIIDSPTAKRQQFWKRVEKTRELTSSALAHQGREVARNLPVDGFDPTKVHHQMGRAMSWREFVARIKRLNNALQIQDSPSAPDKVAALLYPVVVQTETGGTENKLQFLCAFDKAVLPEHTVLMPVYERAWDSEKKDFVRTLKTTKFTRGWREVLVRMLRAGLVRKADVDVVFPENLSGVRKSWYEQLKAPVEEKKQKIQGPLIQLAR